VRIETLYHWAPSDRRESILRNGLQIYSTPTVNANPNPVGYLCMSTCPRRAWALSGDVHGDGEWDLYQVFPRDTDEIRFLPQWGCVVAEVRIYNGLPSDRVWLVGSR